MLSEETREKRKQWREANKEVISLKAKAYYKENKETILAYHKVYRDNNPDKVAGTYRNNRFGKVAQTYYERMFIIQYGLCAICSKSGHTPYALGLDHNHSYNKKDCKGWRGLLCMFCNAGLGAFKEDISMFGGAAKDYLLYWLEVQGEHRASLNSC